MNLPIHSIIPNAERLTRTLFWTLWVITVALTAYALCVESLGVGLFLRDDHAVKLHMRGEAHLAGAISSLAACGLFIVTVIVGRWSRLLRRIGIAALLFFLVYLALPRF